MTYSAPTKQSIVTCSNLAILALCVNGVVQNWSQSAFQLFLNTKLEQVWPYFLIYPAFLLVMPLLPRPKPVAIKTAAAPSIAQAGFMALTTALMDYVTVGCLFLFWDRVCRLEDGSFCPFTAGGTLLLIGVVMPIKDEIQCRFMWRKFISPYKLNSWPYCWAKSFDHISTSSFVLLSSLGLFLSGWVSCESVMNPKVLLQVQVESMLVSDGITNMFMIFGHKWLHEKAYFLHKKHHKATKRNVMAFDTFTFDLLDMVIEFGAGVPGLIIAKRLFFGPTSKVHFLTNGFVLLKGFQGHSGNPYAQGFFVPILDYLGRGSVSHSLHHVVQNDYYRIVPHQNFCNPDARKQDIDLYNKHFKTSFPRSV